MSLRGAHTAPELAAEPLTLDALAARLADVEQANRYLRARLDALSYELLSQSDVARLLEVQPRTAKDFLERGLTAGALIPRTLTGERWAGEGQQRFLRAEVDAWRRMDKRTAKTAPAPKKRRGRKPLSTQTA